MFSLEHVSLYDCKGVTDAGVAARAGLPQLREVDLHGMPNVTHEGAAVFSARVQANYSASRAET